MGIFSKQEKEKTVKTEESEKGDVFVENPTVVKIDKEYPYVVQLNDIEDNTVLRKAPFGARRYIDGANVWLLNEKAGFKEPFPNNTQEFKNYSVDEIDKKLASIKARLDKFRNNVKTKKRVTSDELDLLEELKKFKNYKRSHIMQGNGSYMIISAEHGGRPLYTFDRVGNFKLPVFKNTDHSLLYIPTETDIATAGELLKLNDDENGIKDNTFKLVALGMVIILAVAVIGLGYLSYKTSQSPIELVDSLKALVDSNTIMSNKISESMDQLTNITSKIEISNADNIVNPGTVNINN